MSFVLTLKNKEKVNKFIVLFKYLKNICPDVTMNISDKGLYVQGMCSAHVLMFELNISPDWFDTYTTTFVSQTNLGINCEILFKIINCIADGQMIQMRYAEKNLDKLIISLENIEENVSTLEKEFEVSLMDIDSELLEIPEIETDVDIVVSSNSFDSIINQLIMFGIDVKFTCSEKGMELESSGDSNVMKVKIKDTDIESYAIVEEYVYESAYSLKYLHYITAFSKLNNNLDITFINDSPAKFAYNLDVVDWKDIDDEEGEEETLISDKEDDSDNELEENEICKNNKKNKNIMKFYLAPKMD